LKLRPRGKFLLQRELKLKGVDSGIIASALDNVEIDELTMAMGLIKKRRFNLNGDLDRKSREKEKARAFSYLASKGFNKEIIYKAVLGQYNSD
jgi:SOS response regulatory protein OraA/RecX